MTLSVYLTDSTRLLHRWGLAQKLEEVAGTDRSEAMMTFRCKSIESLSHLSA